MPAPNDKFPTLRTASNVRRQIPDARVRLVMLQRRSAAQPSDSRLLPAALDELERTLHEVQIACDHAQDLVEQQALARAEQERARRRYHALFDGAPEPYVMTTLEGLIMEVNAAGSELLHVSPRWLRHKPLDLYLEERDRFVQELARERDSCGFGEPMELTIRPRERARIEVVARVRRVEGPDGEQELWWVFGPRNAAHWPAPPRERRRAR